MSVEVRKTSLWFLRVGYLSALLVFGYLVFQFHSDVQSDQNRMEHIRAVSIKVKAVEKSYLVLIRKAESIIIRFQDEASKDLNYWLPDDSLAEPMSEAEKRLFLSKLPEDQAITTTKAALLHLLKDAEKKFSRLLGEWRATDEDISNSMVANAFYMPMSDPFKYHFEINKTEHVELVKTRGEFYWAARRIKQKYDNYIIVNNAHMAEQLQRLIEGQVTKQSQRLYNFLLIAGGLIAFLALFVFLPIDYMITRLFRRLAKENQRAEEAVTKALNADRAKSEFLANMSHEIRTPMNGVMGMAELLAKTHLDSKQKTFTDIIVKSGASLLTIINDILDFSKIDAGQMELDPAPFRLAEAIEDVASLVSPRFAEKDLEFIVRVDPELPKTVIGDVGRIRQIVTNLVGNAAKFTEQGHVFVDVSKMDDQDSIETADGHCQLKISVEDTGIGIPKVDQDKIFEKFSQVDASATRRHEGTGLGLAITTALVELMDGEIGMESHEGVGSTFWFTVTLDANVDQGKRHVLPVDVTGSRVLVVDDNRVNRAILSEQMASWRFDSVAVESAQEALTFLSAAENQYIKVDAIVLDYQMPGLNGGDFVRKMRELSLGQNTPVVMLTSVAETNDGKAFSSLGIQGHLMKPARSSLLLETIVNVVQEQKTVDSAGVSNVSSEIGAAKSMAIPGYNAAIAKSQDSKPEQGTPSNKSTEAQPKAIVDEPFRAGSKRILVVEDNEVNQIVMGQILQSIGVSFKVANNGKEGVDLYVEYKPDLILMDISMPVMNGLRATEEIRELEYAEDMHTPIIGVTAHAIKGDMERCLGAGMDDYVSKPVSPDVLTKKINEWLNDSVRQVA